MLDKKGNKIIVGLPATWFRSTSKGYGFISNIACEIVGFTPKRVKIKAFKLNGTYTLHNVDPQKIIVAI